MNLIHNGAALVGYTMTVLVFFCFPFLVSSSFFLFQLFSFFFVRDIGVCVSFSCLGCVRELAKTKTTQQHGETLCSLHYTDCLDTVQYSTPNIGNVLHTPSSREILGKQYIDSQEGVYTVQPY